MAVKGILRRLGEAVVRWITDHEDVSAVYVKPPVTVLVSADYKCDACAVKVRLYFVTLDSVLTVTLREIMDTGMQYAWEVRAYRSTNELVFSCADDKEVLAKIPLSIPLGDKEIEDLAINYLINKLNNCTKWR